MRSDEVDTLAWSSCPNQAAFTRPHSAGDGVTQASSAVGERMVDKPETSKFMKESLVAAAKTAPNFGQRGTKACYDIGMSVKNSSGLLERGERT